MSEKNLAGRKALVTGGARGIGAAIAHALAKAGASVMIGDILEDAGSASAEAIAKASIGFATCLISMNLQGSWAIA